MKNNTRPSFLHRAFRAIPALAALALLPAAAHAASVNITVGSSLPGAEGTIWFERSNHPLRTGDTITILVPTTPAIDELSVVDGVGTNLVFNFRMRNPAGQVQTRQAHVVGVWDADANMAPENGCLAFEYTIQDTDSLVNGELLPPSGSLFGGAGIATAVLTESGYTIRSITGIRAPNPPGANTPFIDWLEPDPPPVTINQQVAITSLAVEFSTESHGTLLYGTGKNYIDFFVVTEPALAPGTLPDDFALSFQFSEKDSVRTAPFGLDRTGTGENGNNGLWFRYIVQESDYSGGDLFLKTGAPLFTTASGYAAIRTADGDRVTGLAQYAYGTPDVAVATDIIVNPDNSNYISIYFLDSDGNRLDPATPQNYWEGDRTVKYVVDIGRVPSSPVTVTIDWGAASVFQQLGATDAPRTTTVEFTSSSSWTGTIDRILDDGAAGHGEYEITATRSDGGNPAIMRAIVLNVAPVFQNLGPEDFLFGTPTYGLYFCGQIITNTVYFNDIGGVFDEPFTVTWYYGNRPAAEANVRNLGPYWVATSCGMLPANTMVSVSVRDKNGAMVATNATYEVVGAEEVIDGVCWQSTFVDGGVCLSNAVIPANARRIVIPSFIQGFRVVAIGEDALQGPGADSIASLTIPRSVKTVSQYAFSRCGNIDTLAISLPSPFRNSSAPLEAQITNLTVEDSFFVEAGELSNLLRLRSLTLPATIVTMDANALTNCPSLLEVHFLGDAPEIIGTGLYNAKPRRLVTYVPEWSIGWDGGFTDALPDLWQGRMICHEGSSGTGPGGMHGGESPDATETLDGVTWTYAFDDGGDAVIVGAAAEDAPTTVAIPATLGGCSVRTVGPYAFASLPGVQSVAISEGIEGIGAGAFERCTKLASITLPSTLTSIGDSAFRECVSLAAIEIPAAVTNIGYFAFRDCLRLESVDYAGEPPHCDLGAWDRVPAFAIRTADGGFVTVVTDIVNPDEVSVPEDWALQYPRFEECFGSDFTAALAKPTGKRDAEGNPLFVWQDYVAGTDPTDIGDRFIATISIVNGSPVVSWEPKLSAAEAAKRRYTILGKTSLASGEDWTPVPAGHEADYNFFKVTVEMK